MHALLHCCILPFSNASRIILSADIILTTALRHGNKPICLYYHASWEQLARCNVLASLVASPNETRDLLFCLNSIQSPLRRVSAHILSREDDHSIVLPTKYRWSRDNQNSVLELPRLDSLRVSSETLNLLGYFVYGLSVPFLEDLECQFRWGDTEIRWGNLPYTCDNGPTIQRSWSSSAKDTRRLPDWSDGGRKHYQALGAFIVRSKQLKTLRISTKFRTALRVICDDDKDSEDNEDNEDNEDSEDSEDSGDSEDSEESENDFPTSTSSATLDSGSTTWCQRQIVPQLQFFMDLLPKLHQLERLTIHGIWEHHQLTQGFIPFPLSTQMLIEKAYDTRRLFGTLRTLRLEYECYLPMGSGFHPSYLSQLIKSWHPEPWVFCEEWKGHRWRKWSLELPLDTVDEAFNTEEEDTGGYESLSHDELPYFHYVPFTRTVNLADLPKVIYTDNVWTSVHDFQAVAQPKFPARGYTVKLYTGGVAQVV